MVDGIRKSVEEAEKILGHPPNVIEIFVVAQKRMKKVPFMDCYTMAGCLMSLFREDMIYCDEVAAHYTCEPREGYYSFSDMFRKKHEGYAIDSK